MTETPLRQNNQKETSHGTARRQKGRNLRSGERQEHRVGHCRGVQKRRRGTGLHLRGRNTRIEGKASRGISRLEDNPSVRRYERTSDGGGGGTPQKRMARPP